MSSGGRIKGGFGNDTLVPSYGTDDLDGDDTVIMAKNQGVDGDHYDGDNALNQRTEGTDTLDLTRTIYSWLLYLNNGIGSGELYGKYPLTIADAEDHKFIQPIAGVNGGVPDVSETEQLPGPVEDVNHDLRVPGSKTPTPGGRASVQSFEVYKMSDQRDIVAVGSRENTITVYGYGGDDVLYSAQVSADSLYGGAGDDVLGSFNQSVGGHDYASNFDLNIYLLLDGGDGNDTLRGGAGFDVLDDGSLLFGVTIEMAGVGNRTGDAFGMATKLVAQPRVVWADSLPDDVDIQAADAPNAPVGTDEIRYISVLLDNGGTDDPSDDLYNHQAASITPERIFRLNPIFARPPDDPDAVPYLEADDLAEDQQIVVLTRYDTATDVFDKIENLGWGWGRQHSWQC